MNKLNFFYFNFNYLQSYFLDRLVNRNNFFFFSYIQVYYLLHNSSSNRFLFLLKLMLLEKFTNNKIKFVLNNNLLKRRKLKVGGVLAISKQKFYTTYLNILYNSLPKLIYSLDLKLNNYYLFYDNKKTIYSSFFYSLTKFLFLNYFTYTLDYYKYYNFFENAIFKLKLKVCTSYKYYLINRDLFRFGGLNVI
uniref:Ribosomal protein L5 n=1 Tax=Naegleria fowleri TaxID=5763 RepID=A0A1D8D6H8_NAEFO|nr:ribosomal protein L5 [Naegleria fowleri]